MDIVFPSGVTTVKFEMEGVGTGTMGGASVNLRLLCSSRRVLSSVVINVEETSGSSSGKQQKYRYIYISSFVRLYSTGDLFKCVSQSSSKNKAKEFQIGWKIPPQDTSTSV